MLKKSYSISLILQLCTFDKCWKYLDQISMGTINIIIIFLELYKNEYDYNIVLKFICTNVMIFIS